MILWQFAKGIIRSLPGSMAVARLQIFDEEKFIKYGKPGKGGFPCYYLFF
jgi:hypothetical protein